MNETLCNVLDIIGAILCLVAFIWLLVELAIFLYCITTYND